MASWKEERDRLVAQTLAFVQQVAATHPAIGHRLEARSQRDAIAVPAADGACQTPPDAPPPVTAAALAAIDSPQDDAGQMPVSIVTDLPQRPSQYVTVSERADITRRVAAFKARQTKLDRERADYYDAIQAQIRSSLQKEGGAERP